MRTKISSLRQTLTHYPACRSLIEGFLILLSLLSIPFTSHSFTYRRPVPELPHIQDPSTATDIYTYSLSFQIHATLFRFDDSNRPTPFLADSVEVSRDQKTYDFKLKDLSFHNGKRISGIDVRKSLENAIRNRAVNFEGFSSIQGFQEFVRDEKKVLSGIQTEVNSSRFSIHLTSPDPELLAKLTDIRFAIWDTSVKDGSVGAGPYKIQRREKGRVVLVRTRSVDDSKSEKDENKGKKNTAERIEYITVESTARAISLFKNGDFDDLFFYSVSGRHLKALSATAHVQSIYFPRTYYFALNARRNKNVETRRTVNAAVNPVGLVKECFPSNQPTGNLIPPGFIGYKNKVGLKNLKTTKREFKKVSSLKVYITQSIGQEECLKTYLEKALSPVTENLTVQIQPLSRVIRDWQSSSVDAFVAYLEGESTVHYFGSFNPKASFPLGVPNNLHFERLYRWFDKATNASEKQVAAEALAKHILSWQSFLPLFHPKNHLIYQKKFERLKTPFQSAALIPITDLNVSANPSDFQNLKARGQE